MGYLLGDWQDNWYVGANLANCVSVHVHYQSLNAQRVANIKATGRQVLAYIVDDPDEANALFAMGVDAVFANDPQLLGED